MCKVLAMIFEYSRATWFLTLSPSEWLDSQLYQYLRDVNSDIDTSKMSLSKLDVVLSVDVILS